MVRISDSPFPRANRWTVIEVNVRLSEMEQPSGRGPKLGWRMASMGKIKAYRVDVLGAGDQVVASQEFVNGPTNGPDALFTLQTPAGTQVLTRLKTHEGGCWVVARSNNVVPFETDLAVGRDAQIPAAQGGYRVRISELPPDRWREAAFLEFRPPTVTVISEGDGYRVTVTPNQQDATFTVVVGDGPTKDAKLPSMPFPAARGFTRGSWLLTAAQGATAGRRIRLGIRGAGRTAVVTLPPAGEQLTVEPSQFERRAPAMRASSVSERPTPSSPRNRRKGPMWSTNSRFDTRPRFSGPGGVADPAEVERESAAAGWTVEAHHRFSVPSRSVPELALEQALVATRRNTSDQAERREGGGHA